MIPAGFTGTGFATPFENISMNNPDSKDHEWENAESHGLKLKKIVSNIRAFLKDNFSIIGAAKPGDIRTVRELEKHLGHISRGEITTALQVMSTNNEIRYVENSTEEFIVL